MTTFESLQDLAAKYVDRLPYSNMWATVDGAGIFFLRSSDDGRRLHYLDLSRSLKLVDATQVSTVDFSSRSFYPFDFDAKAARLYFISDEANKENFNVYALTVGGDGRIQQITHARHCMQATFCDNVRQLVMVDRYKVEGGLFSSKLQVLDLKSGDLKTILDDGDSEYRMCWGAPAVSPDGRIAILTVDQQSMRLKNNLLQVDLQTGQSSHLLPKSDEAPTVFADRRTFDGIRLVYQSDIGAFDALYELDVRTKTSHPILKCERRHAGIGIKWTPYGAYAVAALVHETTDETEIVAAPYRKPGEEKRWRLRGSYGIAGCPAFWILESRLDSPTKWLEPDLRKNTWSILRTLPLVDGNPADLVHNSYRYVTYPSFDGLEIPAFLALPRGPIKGAVITAFYGGENYFSAVMQLFAECGIAWLSPAVRGSWGRGTTWENLLKGDLGGNEILDVMWGARFLERDLGLSPSRIGIEGGSHGGYSVLRAITMPDGFRGQESTYPFAFAVCEAGFADLVAQHDDSNIPDWITNLLGPLEANRALYLDRSPITHFDGLRTPLFVTHGENDQRVPLSTMRSFLARLAESDIPHEIYLEQGQGHGATSRNMRIMKLARELSFALRHLGY